MELKERIVEILEKSGLTASEFADKIGVQRSAISHITSGRNNPSLDFLMKIKTEYPEIDTDWLIFGIEKLNEDKPEVEISEQVKKNSDSYPSLFDDSDFEENEKNIIHETSASQNQKSIKRVILFYDDGSFEDFSK